MNITLYYLGLLAALFLPPQNGDRTYCNARFNFCMEYPLHFTPLGESQNGDGQVFEAPDKLARVTTWGQLEVDPEQWAEEWKLATEGYKLTYTLRKPDWFISSGTNKKGNIVYRKTVRKKPTAFGPAFQSISIEYPPSQQALYKDYCAYIAKSLK